MAEPGGEVTHDTVYNGRVHLVQPVKGFRANSDSLLLAAAMQAGPGDHVLDAGCGCGGALLPAAWRCPEAHFTGLDLDAEMVDLARQGAEKNGFSGRVSVQAGELTEWSKARENAYDAVISNPPYFAPGSITQPGEAREAAYIESVPLEHWIRAMVFIAKPRAPLTLIHRAAELARILTCFDKWTGEVTVLPIHPYPGAEANRVLVRGRKGLKRGRVHLRSGITVRQSKGGPNTDAMQAVQNGEKIDW